MLNAIPFFGWLLSFIFNVSLAIPFWIVWTACDIGRTYFYFVPQVYQQPGFWSCVGVFMAVSILKSVFLSGIFSVHNSSESK